MAARPRSRPGWPTARDDLSIWVVTGDGDALSIGGNHLIHALRRNVPVKILLFNNQIYGLTKGQASPTSEVGKITKSTPFGVADHPFNPLALAIGAEATFVARTLDRDRRHMTERAAGRAQHEGASLVEIYQNCPVFNDGAFFALTEKETQGRSPDPTGRRRADPLRRRRRARRRDALRRRAGDRRGRRGGEDALLVHDPTRNDPGLAFALANLSSDPDRADPDWRLPRHPSRGRRSPSRDRWARNRRRARRPADLRRYLDDRLNSETAYAGGVLVAIATRLQVRGVAP